MIVYEKILRLDMAVLGGYELGVSGELDRLVTGFCECSLWGRGVTVTSVCCEWRRGPLEDFGRLALG